MSSTATATGSLILVLGSRNRKKCREMAELIRPPWEPSHRLARLEIGSLDEFPDAPEVDESAETCAGNARKKAAELARALDRWVLADDSGLTVAALQDAPGVLSARYAGETCDDAANNRKLVEALSAAPDERRGAAFRCALAVADPAGQIRLEAAGACRGRIIRGPRGTAGFGYDPHFLIPEYHYNLYPWRPGSAPTLPSSMATRRWRATAPWEARRSSTESPSPASTGWPPTGWPPGLATLDPPYEPWSEVYCVSVSEDGNRPSHRRSVRAGHKAMARNSFQ